MNGITDDVTAEAVSERNIEGQEVLHIKRQPALV